MTDNLPIRNAVFSPKNQTFVATWNVRKLNQTGNLAQLLREFDEYRLDILGISEVRWLGTGRMTSGNKTVLHSGHENRYERGVGFVLSGRAAKALEGWNTDSNDDTENDFYELLQDTIDNAPRRDLKTVFGDFNAKINDNRCGFESTVGPFASSKELSNNGERLISFCDHNELCIGNTYFQHRQIHKKTWRSPDGRTLNKIDHVCISRRWRSSLQDVRVLRVADIGSDHYMVRAVVKLKLKEIRSTPYARPFAVEKLKDPNLAPRLALEMRNRFDALEEITNLEDEWTAIRDTIKVCAEEVVGRRRGKRKEQWIKDSTWQKIDEKKYAKLQKEQAKTSRELEEAKRRYTELDRLVKKSCRDDKND
uniref:Endo/exonuclease/phosphatase domain-containing protein n=1 Tax=Haemonchus contortus TaxID=6289 RepID=A0A7I4YL78_HAECO